MPKKVTFKVTFQVNQYNYKDDDVMMLLCCDIYAAGVLDHSAIVPIYH